MIERLKANIKAAIRNGKNEKALCFMRVLAKLLYSINQEYKDVFLEDALFKLIQNLFGAEIYQCEAEGEDGCNKFREDKALFYDGFGLDSRGLALIYLKALLKKRRIIYVVNKSRETFIPSIIELLHEYKAKIIYLQDKSDIENCHELKRIIEKEKPKHLFLYTTPWDILGIVVFNYFNIKEVVRYQINLTDHAFWLGVNAFDYCIEFRNYGAYLSNKFREIPAEKLRLLPYYPLIDYNRKFDGFPFSFDAAHQKLVFSGGSLYKTLGAGNLYYHIVRHILDTHSEVVFWYAGDGDDSHLKPLMQDYPKRVYHTKERGDLYQVLKHSYMYLNTYPMVGGLMFQYAAMAGKVPLTLKYDDCANDCLIEQDQLGVVFESLDAFYDEAEKLLSDPRYNANKGASLRSSVISEKDFQQELEKIMQGEKTKFPIVLKEVDTSNFQQTYIERFSIKNLSEILIDRQSFKYMYRLFPKITMTGIIKKIKKYF